MWSWLIKKIEKKLKENQVPEKESIQVKKESKKMKRPRAGLFRKMKKRAWLVKRNRKYTKSEIKPINDEIFVFSRPTSEYVPDRLYASVFIDWQPVVWMLILEFNWWVELYTSTPILRWLEFPFL